MEWIKAKYDRLLLGVFGVIALLLGGLLLMKVLGFKSQFPGRTQPVLREDFGKGGDGAHVDKVKTLLTQPVVFKVPVIDGKPISLFTSAPVIKTAGGETIPILDPKAKQLRPPIDNTWAFENGLNLQREDMAQADEDGDGYTNAEEFLATPKTNPKDKKSTPGIYTKLEYKECIKDPLTIRLNIENATDKEIQFRRTEPASTAFNTPNLKEGDSFAVERGSTELRFKVTKIKWSAGGKPTTALLDDLLTKEPEQYDVELRGKLLELPSRRAKVVCKLGKEEEKIVSEKEEFYFAAEPDTKFSVLKITDDEVELEFTPQGAKDKIKKTYKIPPPP